MEVGLVCPVDTDQQDPPSPVASEVARHVATVPSANRANFAEAVADKNICKIQALVRGSAARKQFYKKEAACVSDPASTACSPS